MTEASNTEALKVFIKDSLGCGCPDKVFEKIDVDKYAVKGYSSELSRIVVGDTLLIYIARPSELKSFDDSIEVICAAGKSDRDINKYNRFRLVVVTQETDTSRESISDRFMQKSGADEKMHIHFVRHDVVDALGI